MRRKHEVNVRKSSVVNFQIGLIIALLFTYVMFEIFRTSTVLYDEKVVIDEMIEEPVEFKFTIEKNVLVDKKVAAVRPKTQKKSNTFEIVDDEKELEKLVAVMGEREKDTAFLTEDRDLKPEDIIEGEDEELSTVPFRVVEFVPVYPGCEKLKTNAERSVCFQEKSAGGFLENSTMDWEKIWG